MRIPGVSSRLSLSGLRYPLRHRWQALLAVTGIALGVAVVLAVDLANRAVRASFELSSAELRGTATHRLVHPSGRLPQTLFEKLYTTPGHPPMAPLIKLTVNIPGQTGTYTLLGVDIFSERTFRQQHTQGISNVERLGDWLNVPGAVLVSLGSAKSLDLQQDAKLSIEWQGQLFDLTVFDINQHARAGSDDWLIVDVATAQSIAGDLSHLSYVDLILDPHSLDWIEQRIPAEVEIVDLGQQTAGVLRLSSAFELNLTAMSLLALLVGLFLIYNAMSFSIVQRRQLFGRLRVLGVTGGQLYGLVLYEGLLLGVVGSVFGMLLGIWLGQGLTSIVAVTVNELYYRAGADAMQLQFWPLAKAVLLGVGGALLASWVPAVQAARVAPLATLSRAVQEQSSRSSIPVLAVTGSVMLGGGFLISLYLPGGVVSAFGGLFVMLLGWALITPLGLPVLQRVLVGFPIGGIWRMATRDLDRHLSRMSTAVAALMVALSATVGVSLMVESMRDSVSDWLQQLLNADVYVTSENTDRNAGLDERVVRLAHQIPALDALSLYSYQSLALDGRPIRLVGAQLAVASRAGYQLIEGEHSAVWGDFDAGSILVSEPLANRLDLTRGDRLSLPAMGGTLEFGIAGVLRDFSSEHGRVWINLAHYKRFWSDNGVSTMALFSSEVDSGQLLQQTRHSLAAYDGLEFTPAADLYIESMEIFERTFRITEVLRILSVAVALIGIFSALMAVQLERRKEFAVLRALGLTRGQVGMLILLESVMLGLVAALMALPAGLIMAWILTDIIQVRAFGWSLPYTGSASILLFTLLLGICASLLASLYPAWRAGHSHPAGQLRED